MQSLHSEKNLFGNNVILCQEGDGSAWLKIA